MRTLLQLVSINHSTTTDRQPTSFWQTFIFRKGLASKNNKVNFLRVMAIIEGGKKQKQMPHPACKLAGKQCLAAALQNILITLL